MGESSAILTLGLLQACSSLDRRELQDLPNGAISHLAVFGGGSDI
jgi:hypothetical protein